MSRDFDSEPLAREPMPAAESPEEAWSLMRPADALAECLDILANADPDSPISEAHAHLPMAAWAWGRQSPEQALRWSRELAEGGSGQHAEQLLAGAAFLASRIGSGAGSPFLIDVDYEEACDDEGGCRELRVVCALERRGADFPSGPVKEAARHAFQWLLDDASRGGPPEEFLEANACRWRGHGSPFGLAPERWGEISHMVRGAALASDLRADLPQGSGRRPSKGL